MSREFDNIWIENAAVEETGGKESSLIAGLYGVRLLHSEKDGGNIYTLQLSESLFMNAHYKRDVATAVKKIVSKLFRRYKINKDSLILAVGLGNEGMTADALGARTLGFLKITEHLYAKGVGERGDGRLAALRGGVSGVTGLDSFDVIKGVTDRVKPDIIVAIDTLASRKTDRLQRVVQITDYGISPGAGVNNTKTFLSYQSLGVPVVTIGVPFVIYARHIISDYLGSNPEIKPSAPADSVFNDLVVTVKEIDVSIDDFASTIGAGINGAAHGERAFLNF